MTQSKDNTTIDISSILDTTGDINLDDYTMNHPSSYTITLDDDLFTNSTGSEYTFNVNDTIDSTSMSWDFGNKIDPDRVVKMCEHYPALKKVWENFYSIYKMVDQDYKGNIEKDGEIPF